MRRLFTGLALVLLAACDPDPLPPEGQLVVGVDTDAWLPRGAGREDGAIARLALFERLRIELFAPGESTPCDECVRDFGIDHETVLAGRASVGFVPRVGTAGYRARVRLYHSGANESAAEPRASSTIEAVIALPEVGVDGIVDVHVTLHTADVSRPRGTLDAPAAFEPGPSPGGLAGTWRSDLVRDCATPAGPDEACVPGGAFWYGDPGLDAPFERLVALSPYFIDLHEVTAAAVRASGLAVLDAQALTADPYLYSADPKKTIHYCTYTQFSGAQEELPVNCVTRDLALRFCALRGATLPSEAQFEFVAGARRDADFPWGSQAPGCKDAVYGRSYDANKPAPWHVCESEGIGVAKPGTGALDRVRLPGGGEVLDLAGNLSEWVSDVWQTAAESCFAENPTLDPVCGTPSTLEPDMVAVRGTPWTDPGGSLLRAAADSKFTATVPQDPRIGFRCARAENP